MTGAWNCEEATVAQTEPFGPLLPQLQCCLPINALMQCMHHVHAPKACSCAWPHACSSYAGQLHSQICQIARQLDGQLDIMIASKQHMLYSQTARYLVRQLARLVDGQLDGQLAGLIASQIVSSVRQLHSQLDSYSQTSHVRIPPGKGIVQNFLNCIAIFGNYHANCLYLTPNCAILSS